MARKPARTVLLATLDYPYPMKVEISAAEFELYSSLAYLDVSKLSKGNHKIEVGMVKGGCCDLKAYAIVKAGMVVAIKVEPCPDDNKPLSKTDRAVVAAAFKKVGRRPAKWKPVGVEEFFRKHAVSKRPVITAGGGCLKICWGDFTPRVAQEMHHLLRCR